MTPQLSDLNDEGQQRAAWQQRLVEAVLARKFDDETLVTMLSAGFDQAHEDGIRDAADICSGIAAGSPAATRIARHIEKALRSLIQMNKDLDSDPARDVIG